MKRVLLYLALLVPYLLIPLALLPFGIRPDTGGSIALLILAGSAIVATLYVLAVYLRSERPRSEFFGMLASALSIKGLYVAWIGYLIAARLLSDPQGFYIPLPVPPEPVRLVINAVGAFVILVSSVYYAVTIYLRRRKG